MKRIFFFLFFSSVVLSSLAQPVGRIPQILGTAKTDINVKGSIYADSALGIPNKDTNFIPLYAGSTLARPGFITRRPQDGKLYYYDTVGVDQWKPIGDLSQLPFLSVGKRSSYDSIGKIYFTGANPTEVKLKSQLQDEGGIGTRDRNAGGALATDTTTAHVIDAYTVGANSVANVRTIALPSNSFHIRLSDQQRKFIQDYQYDAADVSTADDGYFTLVGPGGQRYKAVINDYINAKLFGLDATLSNNATALQAAVNAASTYPGTHTVLIGNGTYAITSNVTVPSNVTLKFVEGGMLSGTATITGGIIDGQMRAQLFTTGVTVHPDAVMGGKFSMRWYGAMADGSDDQAKLQKCLDVCAFGGKIKHLFWPAGSYTILKGLYWERDDNGDGVRDFLVGYTLEGECKTFGGGVETIVYCNNGNSFGFNIQRGKGIVIQNIFLIGNNSAIASMSLTDVMENPSADWTHGNRDQQTSPHAGWVIDGFGPPSFGSGSKYPDFTAKYTDPTSAGSTDILLENCGARYWVVGFGLSMAGVVQNGDLVEYRSCWADFNKVAFATGSSQNRTNKIVKCAIWGRVLYVIDCTSYGDNIGDPPHVSELNVAGYVRWLYKSNSFLNAGLQIKDSHFELLRGLGGSESGDYGKLFIRDSWINLSGDQLNGDGTATHHTVSIYRGEALNIQSSFLSYYASGFGAMGFCAKSAEFDDVTFDVMPFNTQGLGQTNFRHCHTGLLPWGDGEKITFINPNLIPGEKPYFTTDMEFIPPYRGFWDSKYGSITRKKINRTLSRQAYGLKDAQMIYLGSIALSNVVDPDNALGYTHTEFTLATSSDEFKMLQVGDNIITQGTDEFGRANVLHIFGTVASKNGGTGLVVIKHIDAGFTASTINLWIFRPHTLIPVFVLGDIHSNTTIDNVIIEGSATQLPIGITINSPYFPEGTVITNYVDATKTITTSNPANATKTHIDIVSSDWQTIDYGVLPAPVSENVGYKFGDIVYNIRPDLYPDVTHWICTSSGIFNTAVVPTFRPFTTRQPPQLVDNAAADALGVTWYYNTTSSVHRIKNGATWLDVPTWDANTNIIKNGGGGIDLTTVNGAPKFSVTTTGVSFPGNVAYASRQQITSGTATTIGNTVHTVLVNPASVLASHTITMPASPVDGQEITFVFGGTVTSGAVVTSLTISANSGQGLIEPAAITTANAGDSWTYEFNSTTTKWYRKK